MPSSTTWVNPSRRTASAQARSRGSCGVTMSSASSHPRRLAISVLNRRIGRPDVEPFAPERVGEAELIEACVRTSDGVAQRPRLDGECTSQGETGNGDGHALVL